MKEDDKPEWNLVPPEVRDRCYFSVSTDSAQGARLFALMVEQWPELKNARKTAK